MRRWEMTEKKWTPERVRQEVYDARTKLFVVAKVLETGSINLSEHPEWALVIRPLLTEIVDFVGQIRAMMEREPTTGEGGQTE
jgi:hypothetical protein